MCFESQHWGSGHGQMRGAQQLVSLASVSSRPVGGRCHTVALSFLLSDTPVQYIMAVKQKLTNRRFSLISIHKVFLLENIYFDHLWGVKDVYYRNDFVIVSVPGSLLSLLAATVCGADSSYLLSRSFFICRAPLAYTGWLDVQ